VIGRFPWRTLGLPPLRDGSGECLWYAVSGSYKCNPKKILTSDSDGLFTVEDSAGNTIAGEKNINRAIAIVFAPGRIIDGQDRSITGDTPCGENAQADDYLDELNGINNATGDGTLIDNSSISANFWVTADDEDTSTFIQAPITRDGNITKVTFNDVLMLITPKDFEPVYRRMDYWVAERVEGCLNKYAATLNSDGVPFGKYPWASQLSPYDYIDDNGEQFGRISQTPNSSSFYTSMPKVWPIDPHLIDFNSVLEKVLKLKVSELLELLNKKIEKVLKDKFPDDNDDLKILLRGILEELDLVELDLENIVVDDIKDKLESNEKTLLEKLDEAEQKELLKELEKQRCFKDTSLSNLDNWEWEWWNEWKKMVFFAVDDEYCPTCSLTPVSPTMTLSGDAMKMIVLVAGRRLMEERDETKRADYLEGDNHYGNEEFEFKDHATPTFNDVVLGTP